MKYIKLFENFEEKTLYHGGLQGGYDEETKDNIFNQFKEFKHRTAYFSDNPKFAYEYADTKSMDMGLDADRILYTCKFNGNLFSYKNPEDINKLIELIPDTVKVHHGTAWFLDHDFTKEEIIKAIQGISIVYPVEYIANAKIGDEVPDPSYKSDKMMVVDRDDTFVYTIDKRTYISYLRASSHGWSKHFREETKYRDIFEKWRKLLVDIYNENSDSKKTYLNSVYSGEDFDKIVYTINQAINSKTLQSYDYASYRDRYFEIKPEQVDIINIAWKEAFKEFDEIAKKELSRHEWYINITEVKNNDFWNFYENEGIAPNIKKLGYDGYMALEDGHRTYAIFEPQKTIKIIKTEIV